MEEYAKRGKYDFNFNEAHLTEEARASIKNIIDKSNTSDERVAQNKKLLEDHSWEFVDSLSEFIVTYTSINQVTQNQWHIYTHEHILKCTNLVDDQYEDVPYTLRYHVIRTPNGFT